MWPFNIKKRAEKTNDIASLIRIWQTITTVNTLFNKTPLKKGFAFAFQVWNGTLPLLSMICWYRSSYKLIQTIPIWIMCYRYKDIDFTFSQISLFGLVDLQLPFFIISFYFIHNINDGKYKYFLNIVKMIKSFSYT